MKKSPGVFVAVGFSAGLVIALPVALSLWRFTDLGFWAALGYSILAAKGAVLTWFFLGPYSKDGLLRKIMLSFAAGPACVGVGAILRDFNNTLSLGLIAAGLAIHFAIMHAWRTKLRVTH